MSHYSGNDSTVLDHSIHSALVGELPSFGIAKESKFQHLMQRSISQEPIQQALPMQNSDMMNFNRYDTSLSVEAKAFQPNTSGNQIPMQPSDIRLPDTINNFENLDLNASADGNMSRMLHGGMHPNPAANEFIPRNMSAPSLNQHSNGFNVPEFIPTRNINNNDLQQQNMPIMTMMARSNQPQVPPSGIYSEANNSRMTQAMPGNGRGMMDYMPGSHMNQSMPGPVHNRLSSSVFPSPQSQPNSSYYTADSASPQTAGFSSSGTSSSPYQRQILDSYSLSNSTSRGGSDRTSPLLVRRMAAHSSSPLSHIPTDMSANLNLPQSEPNLPQRPQAQESGGTTYFFTQKQPQRQSLSVVMPSFSVFPGPPPQIEYMSLKANAPSFFMANELRQAIIHKHALTMLTVDTEQDSTVPAEVDNYHSLFPLEAATENSLQKSHTFGYATSCYKAIKYKDGLSYCLRRIHGYRQVNEKCMVLVDMWKKIQHANVVHLREVFTSKAFGEHSLVFAHDYHPAAETLMARHFQNPNNTYASKAKWNGGTARQNAGLLPESLIWTYVVQLTSALRCIHAAGLACRVVDPTKIIISDKSRIRLNGVGIFDVLSYDASHTNPLAHMQQYQQEDMTALGKVVLSLACNSVTSFQPEQFHKSIELVVLNYSSDLKNLILYLMTPNQRLHNVNEIMPMIGARFYTQLDAAMMRGDVIENELAKEVENGRLFRMLSKLGVINERPEFGMEVSWSETGDRYLLKLFRDHLFHQVTETGSPWIDLAHIVQCLNKLDAGVPEKVCLMSRDEQNVLVVSYAELKKAYTKCFSELVGNGGL